MRRLTIRREKRFVGCLGTMKVYIEDPTANDMDHKWMQLPQIGNAEKRSEEVFPHF